MTTAGGGPPTDKKPIKHERKIVAILYLQEPVNVCRLAPEVPEEPDDAETAEVDGAVDDDDDETGLDELGDAEEDGGGDGCDEDAETEDGDWSVLQASLLLLGIETALLLLIAYIIIIDNKVCHPLYNKMDEWTYLLDFFRSDIKNDQVLSKDTTDGVTGTTYE